MGNYGVYMQRCKDGQRLQWMQRVFTFRRCLQGLPLHYACKTSQRASAARPPLAVAPLIIVLLKSEKAIKSASAAQPNACAQGPRARIWVGACIPIHSSQTALFLGKPYPDEHLIKDILIQQNKNV